MVPFTIQQYEFMRNNSNFQGLLGGGINLVLVSLPLVLRDLEHAVELVVDNPDAMNHLVDLLIHQGEAVRGVQHLMYILERFCRDADEGWGMRVEL